MSFGWHESLPLCWLEEGKQTIIFGSDSEAWLGFLGLASTSVHQQWFLLSGALTVGETVGSELLEEAI